MQPRIETLAEKKLVGKRITMSLVDNRTKDVWQRFMRDRNKIKNTLGNDLYSVQFYDPSHFQIFDPSRKFEKWATIEVSEFEALPSETEPLILPGGEYAVFLHKGSSSTGAKMFQHIFQVWLPNANYVLDDRPHFELLGAKYKNDDPDSEEEFWIPIRSK